MDPKKPPTKTDKFIVKSGKSPSDMVQNGLREVAEEEAIQKKEDTPVEEE
jgi:hypothetical protein